MELKPGYKRTDVGVIPEDWDVLDCSNLCTKIQDGTHFSPKLGGNKYLYVTSRHIRFGYLDISNADRISELEHRKIYDRCDTNYGDLLLTKDGANTGNAAINTLEEECSLLSSVAFLRFNSKHHDTRFYLQCILADDGQKRIKGLMSGNAITRLTLKKINSLKMPSPSFLEQRAIVEVLSDMDALISKLDQLIAKKRDIKQATMQQLLTGKKRLPGFSGEWKEKKLVDIGNTYGGLTGKSKIDFENGSAQYIPFLNIMNNVVIDHNDLAFVMVTAVEKQNKAQKGDLFFNGSSETPEEVGMCSVLLDDVQDVYLNSFCFGFRLRERVIENGLYLAYFFRSGVGRELLYELAQGSTRYNLSKSAFLKLKVVLPEPNEQSAIATFLSDMDAEIRALQQRRDKTKLLKQGMMQELLTGKTRLI